MAGKEACFQQMVGIPNEIVINPMWLHHILRILRVSCISPVGKLEISLAVWSYVGLVGCRTTMVTRERSKNNLCINIM